VDLLLVGAGFLEAVLGEGLLVGLDGEYRTPLSAVRQSSLQEERVLRGWYKIHCD